MNHITWDFTLPNLKQVKNTGKTHTQADTLAVCCSEAKTPYLKYQEPRCGFTKLQRTPPRGRMVSSQL